MALARRSAELGTQISEEHRAHLLGRLGHKLRSASLALQESARQAAFGRPELMETVFEQAQEVARRAAALEAAAIQQECAAAMISKRIHPEARIHAKRLDHLDALDHGAVIRCFVAMVNGGACTRRGPMDR